MSTMLNFTGTTIHSRRERDGSRNCFGAFRERGLSKHQKPAPPFINQDDENAAAKNQSDADNCQWIGNSRKNHQTRKHGPNCERLVERGDGSSTAGPISEKYANMPAH